MPTFSTIARLAADDCLVKPLLINFFSGDQPFRVKVDVEKSGERAPDGWFHASTHPTWTDRDLYLYLAHPERQEAEQLGYVAKMSMLMGTIMHEVTRLALIQMKVVVPVPVGFCPACGLPQPRMCKEHGAADPATRSRGHLDGILNFGPAGTFGFDLKSIWPMGLSKVPDMDLEYFRAQMKTGPRHYAQAQEYMRLTGLRKFIFLYMGLGNPWEWREFHIPFDPVHCARTEAKYRRVLSAFNEGRQILA